MARSAHVTRWALTQIKIHYVIFYYRVNNALYNSIPRMPRLRVRVGPAPRPSPHVFNFWWACAVGGSRNETRLGWLCWNELVLSCCQISDLLERYHSFSSPRVQSVIKNVYCTSESSKALFLCVRVAPHSWQR